MHRTWKYRLYPTTSQVRELERQLGIACDIYNAALEQRIWAWRTHRVSITFREQSKQLTQARHELPWLIGMSALAQHGVLRRLDRAFQAFYRRVRAGQAPGFPRFKPRRGFRSLTWPQYGNGARVVEIGQRNGRIALHGVGSVKFRAHRPLPENAKLGQVTVTHTASGRWWLTIACDLQHSGVKEPLGPVEPVGIDLGVHTFAALSTGELIPGPRAGRAARGKIRRAHRELARRRKGSRSRRRAARDLARAYEKIAGTRETHHHTVARRLAREHSVLAVEDLQVRNLTRSARGSVAQPGTHVRQKAGLNREILDQGWTDFVRRLGDKVEEAGHILVRVDRRGSSQECPECGAGAPKTLRQRVHRCPGCGLTQDRDVAAAQVIAARAAAQLNGSDESRVEDAPRGAPTKPSQAAKTMRRESSLPEQAATTPAAGSGGRWESATALDPGPARAALGPRVGRTRRLP
jgi:putative transposase